MEDEAESTPDLAMTQNDEEQEQQTPKEETPQDQDPSSAESSVLPPEAVNVPASVPIINIIVNSPAEDQLGDRDWPPTILDDETEEDSPVPLAVVTIVENTVQKIKSPPRRRSVDKTSVTSNPTPRRAPKVQTAQVIYKAAAPVIQDPTKPLVYRPCRTKRWLGSSVGMYSGPDKELASTERQRLLYYKDKHENEIEIGWNPNPSATIPMKARAWKPMTWLGENETADEWEARDKKDQDYRDHKMAMNLGYETLVGNLLYIEIPGGRDINRSWKNFLSPEEMEWGFPYCKGNIDKPGWKLPEPYLAHQVKEKLWKFPKTRIFQAQQEE